MSAPDVTLERDAAWQERYERGLGALAAGDEDAPGHLLACFEDDPQRAEPLHALARHSREAGAHELACALAEHALALPAGGPLDPALERRLYEELMLSAHGARRVELGLAACERLVRPRGQAREFYEYVARNGTFYASNVEALRRGHFALSRSLLSREGVEYSALNPSVVRRGDRCAVNVRLVNYRVEGGRSWISKSSDGVIRTRNVTLDWDPETEDVLSETEWTFSAPATWSRETRVRGLEDVRWTEHRGGVWFTATCYELPEHAGSPQVVLGRMNPTLDAVEHVTGLRYAGSGPVEKNWLPWSLGGVLYLVYAYDPLTVLHVDPSSGTAEVAFRSTPGWYAESLRGAAAPIRVPESERWLAVVHEVAHFPAGRVYTHRFVELDRRFRLVAASAPFRFDHRGIEYAAGLCLLGEDRLLVTYGWNECEARWVELSLSGVLARLRALPHPVSSHELDRVGRVPERDGLVP